MNIIHLLWSTSFLCSSTLLELILVLLLWSYSRVKHLYNFLYTIRNKSWVPASTVHCALSVGHQCPTVWGMEDDAPVPSYGLHGNVSEKADTLLPVFAPWGTLMGRKKIVINLVTVQVYIFHSFIGTYFPFVIQYRTIKY